MKIERIAEISKLPVNVIRILFEYLVFTEKEDVMSSGKSAERPLLRDWNLTDKETDYMQNAIHNCVKLKNEKMIPLTIIGKALDVPFENISKLLMASNRIELISEDHYGESYYCIRSTQLLDAVAELEKNLPKITETDKKSDEKKDVTLSDYAAFKNVDVRILQLLYYLDMNGYDDDPADDNARLDPKHALSSDEIKRLDRIWHEAIDAGCMVPLKDIALVHAIQDENVIKDVALKDPAVSIDGEGRIKSCDLPAMIKRLDEFTNAPKPAQPAPKPKRMKANDPKFIESMLEANGGAMDTSMIRRFLHEKKKVSKDTLAFASDRQISEMFDEDYLSLELKDGSVLVLNRRTVREFGYDKAYVLVNDKEN